MTPVSKCFSPPPHSDPTSTGIVAARETRPMKKLRALVLATITTKKTTLKVVWRVTLAVTL
jgi:hypothetical protein